MRQKSTIMELKLFTDLIGVLSRAAVGLKTIVNLPKAERETIRRTLDETYRLIDTRLKMVIDRLVDSLLDSTHDDFMREAARLDTYIEWIQAEREFRLYSNLPVALRETETLAGRMAGTVSARHWEAQLQQMQYILVTEGEVAMFISQQFRKLADDARSAMQDKPRNPSVCDALAALRPSLVAERQVLLTQELALYEIV